MTIIVAVRDCGNVWMGSDSFTGNSAYSLTVARPKMFSKAVWCGGHIQFYVRMGVTGDHRGDALLRHVKLPEYDDSKFSDLDHWIFIDVPEAIRQSFKEAGYSHKEDDQEAQGLTVLIACKGHIYSMWENYDMIENAEDYMAIGSGMYVALGALYATAGLNMIPEDRVRQALGAAAAHNAYVRPPFHVECA